MRVAMAQINSTVGDLKGNIKKIREYIENNVLFNSLCKIESNTRSGRLLHA